MSFEKRRTLMKAFSESQFNYCLLKWMFHSRAVNNKINRIHERTLSYSSNFDELLKKDGLFSIHDRNIQTLAVEIYKFFRGHSPSIMKFFFHVNTNNPYSLRSSNELYCRNPNTVKYGTEAISCLAPKIWPLVPEIIKGS